MAGDQLTPDQHCSENNLRWKSFKCSRSWVCQRNWLLDKKRRRRRRRNKQKNLESVKEVVSYDDHGTTPSCPAFAADGKFGHLLKFTCLAFKLWWSEKRVLQAWFLWSNAMLTLERLPWCKVLQLLGRGRGRELSSLDLLLVQCLHQCSILNTQCLWCFYSILQTLQSQQNYVFPWEEKNSHDFSCCKLTVIVLALSWVKTFGSPSMLWIVVHKPDW